MTCVDIYYVNDKPAQKAKFVYFFSGFSENILYISLKLV